MSIVSVTNLGVWLLFTHFFSADCQRAINFEKCLETSGRRSGSRRRIMPGGQLPDG